MNRFTRVRHQCLAAWKLVASYFKRDWAIDDYPVITRKQVRDPASIYDSPRFTLPSYIAFIVNWHLSGTGESPNEAKEALAKMFTSVRADKAQEGKTLPRPGTNVPIEFASTVSVDSHPELAQDFVERVLDLDWAWISDESSLWDFHAERSNDDLIQRVRSVYGVDVSDIESGRIYQILDRIATAQAAHSERIAHPVS